MDNGYYRAFIPLASGKEGGGEEENSLTDEKEPNPEIIKFLGNVK